MRARSGLLLAWRTTVRSRSQEGGQLVGGERAADMVAPHLVASGLRQEVDMAGRLHAFRYHVELQAVSQRDDAASDGAVRLAGLQVAHASKASSRGRIAAGRCGRSNAVRKSA